MTNWTRAHDAWIARECEGLEVWVNASDGAISECQCETISHYLTDPAAAIRAAEAWRIKRGNRCGWEMGHGDTPVANTFSWSTEKDRFLKEFPDHVTGDTPAAALAQALYRATGGPA